MMARAAHYARLCGRKVRGVFFFLPLFLSSIIDRVCTLRMFPVQLLITGYDHAANEIKVSFQGSILVIQYMKCSPQSHTPTPTNIIK